MSIYDQMQVTVPEGTCGDVTVKRFDVDGKDIMSLRYEIEGRGCRPGAYTRLDKGNCLWMSDTTAERRDHLGAAYEIKVRGGRVLIGGLGLGMIVNFALQQDKIEHIDVVEIDTDVLDLIAPHYAAMAKEHGKSIAFHCGDVFTQVWPKGTRWDVAWFDVWGDVSDDDMPAMTKLRRSYARRADWCRCWGQDLVRRYR